MKIEKKYVWNIERKSRKYWFSFILLLFPCVFKVSIFNGPVLFIYQYIDIKTEIFGRNYILLRCLNFILLIGLILVLIMSIEVFFSFGKRNQNRDKKTKSLYSFICYLQFKADIFILVTITMIGIFEIYQNTEWLHTDSLIFILFLISLLIGVYINISCIFPWRNYRKIQNSLKEQKGIFQEAWICISTNTEISTFSVLPGACEKLPVVITEKELSIINEKKNCMLAEKEFNKLLVYIEGVPIEETFRSKIEKYSSYLHMRCLIILKDESQYIQYKKEIDILNDRMGAQIAYIHKNIYSLNILDEYLSVKYTYNVVKCLKEGGCLQNMGKVLDDVYFNIIHGPEVAVKFFRICLIEPNLSKAIYKFFDYIDLQYRLACAFFVPTNEKWYIKNSENIGKFVKMFKFLEGNIKDLAKVTGIENQYILDDHWWNILEKYLPNCNKKFRTSQRMGSKEINELSAELRNKLRAHQDIERMDVPVLLNLVFRVAIATNYLLGINQMHLAHGYDGNIIGNYKDIERKLFSKFLKWKQGYYWVFNNAKSGDMEYINFLTGEVRKF